MLEIQRENKSPIVSSDAKTDFKYSLTRWTVFLEQMLREQTLIGLRVSLSLTCHAAVFSVDKV